MPNRYAACSLWSCLALVLAVALGVGCSEDTSLKVHRLSKDKGVPGDTLTIYGAGFQARGTRGVRVYFGNAPAKVRQFVGDEEIIVEVPGGNEMGKTVDVQLIFEPGGTKRLTKAFKYVEISRLEVDHFEKKDDKGAEQSDNQADGESGE